VSARDAVHGNGNNCLVSLPALAAAAAWLPGEPRDVALLGGSALRALGVLLARGRHARHRPPGPRRLRRGPAAPIQVGSLSKVGISVGTLW